MHKQIAFIILIGSTLLWACKNDRQEEPIAGRYIEEIRKETIHFTDGSTYELNLQPETRVFYLVRHAEKDTFPQHDPDLTPEGVKRADRLFEILKGTRVDDIYSTLTMRTLATGEPLANGKGLKMRPYESRKMKELYQTIVDSTRAKRIVVIGHSNNLPAFANYLGDKEWFSQSWDESDYDNLVIILDQDDNKEVLPLRYTLK